MTAEDSADPTTASRPAVSRDGKRVYWTNSLYSTWDAQFYPAGMAGAMVKADVGPDGGLTLDKDFSVEIPAGLPSFARDAG